MYFKLPVYLPFFKCCQVKALIVNECPVQLNIDILLSNTPVFHLFPLRLLKYKVSPYASS